MRALLALVLLSASASAQTTGRVEGRVISNTGQAISKATVRITGVSVGAQRATSYVEVTSNDGRFVMENVAPGKYAASAQRSGYAPARSTTSPVLSVNFELGPGETKTGIEVRLTPLAVVSGIVTDADGDPAPSMRVSLMRYTASKGKLTLSANTATINTDDRGMFRLPNVQPGRYYLLAAGNPIPPALNEIRGRSAEEMSLPTYFPNARDARAAVAIDVASAEVSNLAIRMRRGRTYSIKGTIVDSSGGSPQPQITVFPKGADASAQGMMTNFNGQQRTFQIGGLESGDYTIVVRSTSRLDAPPAPPGISPSPGLAIARPAEQAAAALSGRVDVSVGTSDLENVAVRLSPGAELTGRVTIDGGIDLPTFMGSIPAPPPPGNRAVAVNPGDGFQVALPPRLPSISILSLEGPTAQLAAAFNGDGTFRIANIPPLKRALQIGPLPAAAYVKSIRFGGQDITRAPLDLSSGSGGVLDIVISPKGAEITVQPRNDKGEALPEGAPVTIWPRTPNPGSSTGDIRFMNPLPVARVQGLAPGEYYIAAWGVGNSDYLRTYDFLNRFTGVATKVTVAEGEAITVEPKVISRESVEKEMAQLP